MDQTKLIELAEQIKEIYEAALAIEKTFEADLATVHPKFALSARNLLHYIALRNHDIRPLQVDLAQLGLSSLGRMESRVLPSLYLVYSVLCQLAGHENKLNPPPFAFTQGHEFLEANTVALLGESTQGREVAIMVTLPSEAATDYDLIEDLIAEGMQCARINCAHDEAEDWRKMVEYIQQAEQQLGTECKILMDLGGPKLRTGSLKPGPQFVRFHPRRDELGRVIGPCQIWLGPANQPIPPQADAYIPLPEDWLAQLQPDDIILFVDTRGKRGQLPIQAIDQDYEYGRWSEIRRTAYLQTGDTLQIAGRKGELAQAQVGDLPPLEIPIVLKTGDRLIIHRADEPGEPAQYQVSGEIAKPAHISCTLPHIFEWVKAGEPIKLDDGAIEGVIAEVSPAELTVEITYTKPKGSRLRADKGINLPKSHLRISGLTDQDRLDLEFVAPRADIISMSFVNETEDVLALQEELRRRNASDKGIVLKIETRRGFNNLPMLLLAAMQHYPVGVMIARGDLAVEAGWKRLAEVQEQILWLCEAAHIPCIWATQVLENLAKTGLPSRAEISDVATAQRAECVMLNKGPNIKQAIRLLKEILHRMQAYHNKKMTMLRQLKDNKVIHFEEIPE